jgi:uncharacterized protein YigE (DUF2233 family)
LSSFRPAFRGHAPRVIKPESRFLEGLRTLAFVGVTVLLSFASGSGLTGFTGLREETNKALRSTGKKMRVSTLLKIVTLFAAVGLLFLSGDLAFTDETIPWKEVDEGLLVAEFESVFNNTPYSITVVKIDPEYYSFRLLCATEHGRQPLTPKEWASKYQMVAAVNAGMFQEDGLTSVGFMKNFAHVNNPRLSKANAILAFNPVEKNIPEIQLIDRECQDFNGLRQKYQSFVQSIRMISCNQQNVWSRQDARWSTLAVGMDAKGNVLLLFSRTPHSVHDFIDILLSLPLSLQSAMYLEGGPQASLYLSTSGMTLERCGVWGGLENSSIQFPLPVPNVIGISKKPRAKT